MVGMSGSSLDQQELSPLNKSKQILTLPILIGSPQLKLCNRWWLDCECKSLSTHLEILLPWMVLKACRNKCCKESFRSSSSFLMCQLLVYAPQMILFIPHNGILLNWQWSIYSLCKCCMGDIDSHQSDLRQAHSFYKCASHPSLCRITKYQLPNCPLK